MPGGGAVLGISADYHDAAACLLVDGVVVAAAAEERFTRRKHDPDLPREAIAWCLRQGEIAPGDLAAVAFYSKPFATYERILATHAVVGPVGFAALAEALQTWSGRKLWVAGRIERLLRRLGHPMPELVYAEHHQAHAASAFFGSPFERAAVLTFDGVGEWTTSSIGWGRGNQLALIGEQRFPDSLGLFYSTMTAQCGFAVNDGEYKLMGLAPYGEPSFADQLREHVLAIGDDGSFRLDQRFFGYRSGRRMGSRALDDLLGGAPRAPDAPLGQREADIARSAQVVLEEAVLAAARHAHRRTGERAVCLAGGVALNCVANAVLRRDGPFESVWVQPASGDDGGALGAAWWTWFHVWERPRTADGVTDAMRGAALGPSFTSDEIERFLADNAIAHRRVDDRAQRDRLVAESLAEGAVVGWFAGPMEFGPRALGHRSILADARDPSMVTRINQLVKEREGFRPFAPAVLADDAEGWFDVQGEQPYMLFTAPVAARRGTDAAAGSAVGGDFGARLAQVRSSIPSCTHVDGSARLQTVDEARAPDLHGLLRTFKDLTGCPVLLNTSFNGRDEPIVCTPADAIRTFARTGLDLLVLEGCLVTRADLDDAGVRR